MKAILKPNWTVLPAVECPAVQGAAGRSQHLLKELFSSSFSFYFSFGFRFALGAVILASGITGSGAWAAAGESTQLTVLPSDNIFGNAKIGYVAAKKVPDICAKLFCYCGCDLSDNHSTLLDCFTSDHGVDCSICQEEAIMAMKMSGDGKTLADIQKTIDQKYIAEYNEVFKTPSPALLKYREQRVWKPTPAEQNTESTAGTKIGDGASSTKSAAPSDTTSEKNDQAAKASGAAAGKATNERKSEAKVKKTGSCCGHK